MVMFPVPNGLLLPTLTVTGYEDEAPIVEAFEYVFAVEPERKTMPYGAL